MKISKSKLIIAMSLMAINYGELAKRAGISRGTLSSVANGKSCYPETFRKISKALDVPVEELIEQEG